MAANLRDRLEECLKGNNAEEITDIIDVYEYWPNFASAELGSGSYGFVYRMRSIQFPDQPPRAVKVLQKARVSRTAKQVQHVCAELAVTGGLQHENLNRRVGLYHTEGTMYIVLELCDGGRPDLSTRLYHVFAKYAPFRIPDVARLVAESGAAAPAGEADDARIAREDLVVRNMTLYLKPEFSTGLSLLSSINLHKKLPVSKSLVIMKQIFAGLAFLHGRSVVHRDVKVDNIMICEERRSTPVFGPDGATATGVRITEKVMVQIVDFGLSKFVRNAAEQVVPDGPGSPAPSGMLVEATNVGTYEYCPYEFLASLPNANGNVWSTTVGTLRKLDVFGAGTAMFCMLHGRAPFYPKLPTPKPPKAEILEEVRKLLVRMAPAFGDHCSPEVRAFVMKLLTNDVGARYRAQEALQDPIFANVTGEYTYTVYSDGRIDEEQAPGAPAAAAAAEPEPDDDGAALRAEVAEIMEVVRCMEDCGDGAGKDE